MPKVPGVRGICRFVIKYKMRPLQGPGARQMYRVQRGRRAVGSPLRLTISVACDRLELRSLGIGHPGLRCSLIQLLHHSQREVGSQYARPPARGGKRHDARTCNHVHTRVSCPAPASRRGPLIKLRVPRRPEGHPPRRSRPGRARPTGWGCRCPTPRRRRQA